VTALSSALGGRLAWDRVLREISLVLPEDVWLTSLSAQAPSAAAAADVTAPAGFSINGKTYSHDGVARLLGRLAVVPHLSSVQLQSSARATSETGRSVIDFSINATVKAAGAA
jgi:Tfp pilus assembly protein PilN